MNSEKSQILMGNIKIGILTSGGDCGGLNAAIRSIFFRAKTKYNMEVFGIRDGTIGLTKRPVDVEKLTHETFKGYLLRQGTFWAQTIKVITLSFQKMEKL